jgi:hypothetical protein
LAPLREIVLSDLSGSRLFLASDAVLPARVFATMGQ